jgi:hypothetical protein
MVFSIDHVEGRAFAYKVWSSSRKSWWATPTGQETWLTVRATKKAILKHVSKMSKRHRIIQCICIVFREVDEEGNAIHYSKDQ